MCKFCGLDNPVENPDTGYCASYAHALRKADKLASRPLKIPKPIPKRSKKMVSEMAEYLAESRPWLVGKMCVVYPELPATQVHHSKGREGYADNWARDHNITLLHDKRWWKPVSDDGHKKIEAKRAWAERMGFTYSRSEKIDDTQEYRTI